MLNLLGKMTVRYGVRRSTAMLVLVVICTATLFDYIYYAMLLDVEMYDGWFYSDLLIATAVGWPLIGLLLSLLDESQRQQVLMNDALSQVKELKSLLAMCAGCKKIRDESNQWHDADEYIRANTNSKVSHGLCPCCQAAIESS